MAETSEFDAMAAQYGTDAGFFPMAVAAPRTLLEQSIGLDPDTAILTREEAAFPDSFTAEERAWAPASAKTATRTVVDLTVGDVYSTYHSMDEAQRRNFQERLYGAGMYQSGVKQDDIYREDRTLIAIRNAIVQEGNRGRNPLEIQAPAGFEMPTPAPERKMSLAQIQESADRAAGSVLGRRATPEERRLAVSIIRQFEADEQTPSGADLRSAFREGSPREASSRGMEQTMQLFQRIIGGR